MACLYLMSASPGPWNGSRNCPPWVCPESVSANFLPNLLAQTAIYVVSQAQPMEEGAE